MIVGEKIRCGIYGLLFSGFSRCFGSFLARLRDGSVDVRGGE